MDKRSAGYLRERLDVLAPQATAEGWGWLPARRTWAGVELTGKRSLFSSVGIGARSAAVTLRRQPLEPGHLLLWRGMYLYVATVTEPELGWMEAECAVVDLCCCTARRAEVTKGKANRPVRDETKLGQFSAVLTERYMGYGKAEDGTHVVATNTMVLVTPTAVELDEGDLVDVADGPGKGTYYVTVCHRLDRWKAEYEMERKKDV